MTLQDLIDHVGQDLFDRACALAWSTAAETGGAGRVGSDTGDVPHELESLVWGTDAAAGETVALAFELYRAMPCYANLMYGQHHVGTLDPPARSRFWAEYRELLSDPDDRLADPVSYSLWCDYFEDPEAVGDAWSEMNRPDDLSVFGVQRLLDAAGPVPYRLKAPLYDRLADDPAWHVAIARSLVAGAFDVYGDLDRRKARKLLGRLDVPEDTPGLPELREKLGLR